MFALVAADEPSVEELVAPLEPAAASDVLAPEPLASEPAVELLLAPGPLGERESFR